MKKELATIPVHSKELVSFAGPPGKKTLYHSLFGESREKIREEIKTGILLKRGQAAAELEIYELEGLIDEILQNRISKRFATIATSSHPDVTSDEKKHERFLEAFKAYKVLGNPKRRKEYDASLLGPLLFEYAQEHAMWTLVAASDQASVGQATQAIFHRNVNLILENPCFHGKIVPGHEPQTEAPADIVGKLKWLLEEVLQENQGLIEEILLWSMETSLHIAKGEATTPPPENSFTEQVVTAAFNEALKDDKTTQASWPSILSPTLRSRVFDVVALIIANRLSDYEVSIPDFEKFLRNEYVGKPQPKDWQGSRAPVSVRGHLSNLRSLCLRHPSFTDLIEMATLRCQNELFRFAIDPQQDFPQNGNHNFTASSVVATREAVLPQMQRAVGIRGASMLDRIGHSEEGIRKTAATAAITPFLKHDEWLSLLFLGSEDTGWLRNQTQPGFLIHARETPWLADAASNMTDHQLSLSFKAARALLHLSDVVADDLLGDGAVMRAAIARNQASSATDHYFRSVGIHANIHDSALVMRL